MILFTKFLFQRLIPVRFWLYGIFLIVLTVCASFVGDFWSGLLTLVIGFPVWIVVGVVCVYKEIQSLRKQLVTLGTETNLESLQDVEKRGETISSICKIAGCDDKNPLIANYVLDTLITAKSKVSKKKSLA